MRSKSTQRLALLILLLSVACVYWQVRTYEFINYDDNVFVENNAYLQDGLTWLGFRWSLFSQHFLAGIKEAGYWAPVPHISHMFDYEIYGQNPWGHHVTNLAIHLLNICLVVLVLKTGTGSYWRSLCVAALFGLHPMSVESVAWIVERKGLLCTTFTLLTLYHYIKYMQTRRLFFYGAALASFQLALMSKPIIVCLPAILFCLHFWPLKFAKRERLWLLLVRLIPMGALSILSAIQTVVSLSNLRGIVSHHQFPWYSRILLMFENYAHYFYKTVIPMDYSIFYPLHGQYHSIPLALFFGVVLGFSLGGIYLYRRRFPFLLTGFVWWIFCIFPVNGLVQAGGQSIANRYAYMANIGLFIMFSWLLFPFVRWIRIHFKFASHQNAMLRRIVFSGLILLFAISGWISIRELSYWRNSSTLFKRALETTHHNIIAHLNYGVALRIEGNLKASVDQLNAALRLEPHNPIANYNLGIALYELNRPQEAVQKFNAAIQSDSRLAEGVFYLALIAYDAGDISSAVRLFEQALQIKPLFPSAYYDLAHIYYESGDYDKAIYNYSIVLKMDPDADAFFNMGLSLAAKGLKEDAIKMFKAALIFDPQYTVAQKAIDDLSSGASLKDSRSPNNIKKPTSNKIPKS